MVLPVVVPMFTGAVVVVGMLIPANEEIPTPVMLMPDTVFPCTELAGVVADVVFTLIPMNGVVVPLKVNPAIVLPLITVPPIVPAAEIAVTAPVVGVVMLVPSVALPMVLPVVVPIFTGQVVLAPMLMPRNAFVFAPVMLMPCMVFPCIELEVVVTPVVVMVIPVKGVAAVVVNPAMVLLLMAEPLVALLNEIAVMAPVVGVAMLFGTVVLPIVLPVVVPIFTRLLVVAMIPVKVSVLAPCRLIA